MERVEDCVAEERDGGWPEGEGGMRFALIYAFYLVIRQVLVQKLPADFTPWCRLLQPVAGGRDGTCGGGSWPSPRTSAPRNWAPTRPLRATWVMLRRPMSL